MLDFPSLDQIKALQLSFANKTIYMSINWIVNLSVYMMQR